MGKVGTSYLLTQLGYQAPALLVYLVAFILALVYKRRASMPCILTLVGVGILVITTLGMAVMQASLRGSTVPSMLLATCVQASAGHPFAQATFYQEGFF